MPAMIGGFGKIKYKLKRHINTTNDKLNENNSLLGPYLAGLIEADGSFAIYNENSKARPYKPKILIVFSLVDKPLAEKLKLITQVGTIQIKNNANYVIWHVQTINDVVKLVNIVNGYMRTPKIEALHRAIAWFNKNTDNAIAIKGLDNSPINSNGWLAGFTDGNGIFSITLTNKKGAKVTSKRVQAFFRIELRQNYYKKCNLDNMSTSSFNILNKIATYLGVTLYSTTREQGKKLFHLFMVASYNRESHLKAMEYFDKFPLYSSKHLAYKDWRYVVNKVIRRNKAVLSVQEIADIETIKNNFNSKRKSFNFDHLDTLI